MRGGGAEGGSARTIQGLCMSLWAAVGLETPVQMPQASPGDNAQTSETPRTLEASSVPKQGSGCTLQPPSWPGRSCSSVASSSPSPCLVHSSRSPGAGRRKTRGLEQWLPDRTKRALVRGDAKQPENMPEVTSRAQGTKKESGRNIG